MNMDSFPNKLAPNVISPPNVKPLDHTNYPRLCTTDCHVLVCAIYIDKSGVFKRWGFDGKPKTQLSILDKLLKTYLKKIQRSCEGLGIYT